MKKKKSALLLLTLPLLFSCGGGEASTSSSSSVNSEAERGRLLLEEFSSNMKTNKAKIETYIQEDGKYHSFVTYDYYGDNALFESFGEYIRQKEFSETGRFPTDAGVLVNGDQGFFYYTLDEGAK